jgi:hypothetical protein
MNEERIEQLRQERSQISDANKQKKLSQKWHRAKAEDLLAEAAEHLKKVKELDEELSESQKKYFDKGTELETLTNKKRIQYLR